MKRNKGKIDNRYVVERDGERYVCGTTGIDGKHFIRTSKVMKITAGTVETLNSVYTLGTPRAGATA